MLYTIMLWTLIPMITIWIFTRLFLSIKKTNVLLQMNRPHHMIRSWTTRNSTMTALIVILSWWLSYMFVESLKLTFIDLPDRNDHIIAVIFIPIVMITIYFIANLMTTRKHHIQVSEICSQIDRTFCIMIAFLYALTVSYGIEAIILLSA
jgi:hypothetical protein